MLLADMVALIGTIALFGTITLNSGVLVGATVALFAAAGLYRIKLSPSALDDAPAIAAWLLIISALAAAFRHWLGDDVIVPTDRLRLLGLMILAVILGRVVAYAVIVRLRRRGRIRRTALIVGAGDVGSTVARVLVESPTCGLQPIGFVDSDPLWADESCLPTTSGGPLEQVLAESAADAIIISFGTIPDRRLVEMLRHGLPSDIQIYVVPRLFELQGAPAGDLEMVHGLPLVRLRTPRIGGWTWRLKRLMDIVLSMVLLTLLAPLMALCALAVRLESGPGVLFRQQRIGFNGHPFTILKFRSLRPASDEESSVRWSVAGDARVGKAGRVLRATSMDELPQLWNVFRGDMSLVGPRPERPHYVDEFTQRYPTYSFRHRVPSGLTGFAQVNGLRGDTSILDRARFDNAYIEGWSLWLDVKILLRTALSVVKRAGS